MRFHPKLQVRRKWYVALVAVAIVGCSEIASAPFANGRHADVTAGQAQPSGTATMSDAWLSKSVVMSKGKVFVLPDDERDVTISAGAGQSSYTLSAHGAPSLGDGTVLHAIHVQSANTFIDATLPPTGETRRVLPSSYQHVAVPTRDGSKQEFIFVNDDDPKSNKPPTRAIFFVNGVARMAMSLEYLKWHDTWIVNGSRLVAFDSAGQKISDTKMRLKNGRLAVMDRHSFLEQAADVLAVVAGSMAPRLAYADDGGCLALIADAANATLASLNAAAEVLSAINDCANFDFSRCLEIPTLSSIASILAGTAAFKAGLAAGCLGGSGAGKRLTSEMTAGPQGLTMMPQMTASQTTELYFPWDDGAYDKAHDAWTWSVSYTEVYSVP